MLALLMPALSYQMEGANRFVFLLAMTVYIQWTALCNAEISMILTNNRMQVPYLVWGHCLFDTALCQALRQQSKRVSVGFRVLQVPVMIEIVIAGRSNSQFSVVRQGPG